MVDCHRAGDAPAKSWMGSVCNKEGFEPFPYKCSGTHCLFQACLLIFEFLDDVDGFFNGNT